MAWLNLGFKSPWLHIFGNEPFIISRCAVRPLVENHSRMLRVQCAERALNYLWRLSKCPDKRTPHSFAVSKTILSGNFISRKSAGLHHQPC